jgi:transcriptional regulator with XRE-family HTH domain
VAGFWTVAGVDFSNKAHQERMMAMASLKAKVGPGRSRAQDIDRYVGARMRERRIMLGLTQQQMAELIGVTYQQAHKYEKGINRIAAGRLFTIAQALGVDVGYFFDGMNDERSFKPTPQQRMLLELARNFIGMPSRKHQEALCNLARALANPELVAVHDLDTNVVAD